MDNLPSDPFREAKLLAASTPAPILKNMMDHAMEMGDFEAFKKRFGVDFSPIEEYVEHDDESALEGWLFVGPGHDGAFDVRKYEADPLDHFASDAEAASYVAWRAAQGSLYIPKTLSELMT